MSYRERTRSYPRNGGQSGAFTWDYPGPPGANVTASSTFCGDQTGIGDNMPLIIDSHRNEGGVINKPFDGYWSSWFVDYVADIQRGAPEGHLGVSTPGDNYVATKAAASCNPSKPYVDVPLMVTEELRGSVLAIRDRGRSLLDSRQLRPRELARAAGSANLQYQFGFRQLGGDLAKLTDLQREINNRITVIEDLWTTRGFRCNYQQGTYSANERQYRYMQSAGDLIGGYFDVETTQRVWAHTRWAVAEGTGLKPAPAEIARQARDAVAGLTVDASTAWNLYPWTWLGDWFGSVGDYLAAKRNIIPATLIEVVVMRHAITLATHPEVSFKNVYGIPTTMTAIARTRERKSRAYSYPTPFAVNLPFLNGRQVGILASIAATHGSSGRGRR